MGNATPKAEAVTRGARMLRTALGPDIATFLEDPAIVEVMLNPDGRLWIDRLSEGLADTGATLLPADGERIIRLVAHHVGAEVHSGYPRVSAELPGTGERFEGLLPPVVAAPAFAIRKPAVAVFTLDDYACAGIMSSAQATCLRKAVIERRNILVAGGTSTGKTTLTNAILAELVETTPEHRLVILEDTAEIQCAAENHVILHTTDTVDMGRLLKSTMRLRPDRIIVGEVRDGAALTLLKAWNTGHPGGIATVHSNSAGAALTRLEQLVAEVSSQPMPEVIGEAVDLIVSIERAPGGRTVREILKVEGFRDGRYLTTPVGASKSESIQGRNLHVV